MLDFFSSKTIPIKPDDIYKEGALVKQSRVLKTWRERWCVLTKDFFYTFKEPRVYKNPTEEIPVSKIKSIKSEDVTNEQFAFRIETADSIYLMKAKDTEEKEQWIGIIGKVMVGTSNSNLFVAEEDD